MKGRNLLNYILLGAVGALIFSLSEYIQWYGDSYQYRFHFGTGEPIDNFWNVFPSQYAHYFILNGRVWAHVLCQGFSALWGQTAFAVCNALMYVAFVLVFVKIVGGSWQNTSTLLSCILVILFFTDTSYNTNCQIGYIWTSTITLVFIIYYFKYRDIRCAKIWQLVLLFLLSILAGNGNEAIAIGVGAALIFDFFTNFRKLTSPQWVMLIGFGFGGLLLCLSPGIIRRASNESPGFLWSAYHFLYFSRMVYLLILVLTVLKIWHRIKLKLFIKENSFFITALITLLILNFIIGIGERSGRQLFGVELFSGILAIRALKGFTLPRWSLIIFSIVIIGIYTLKFYYLAVSNEDLRTLRIELEKSEDYKIFMDFHHYPSFVHPTELDNTSRMYRIVAYAIIDDMVNFGHAYRYAHGIIPPYFDVLEIYPTMLKKVLEYDDKNFAVKCEDGNYLIVMDKEKPKHFTLEREYSLLGLKWPKEPYEIDLSSVQDRDNNGIVTAFCDFETPLIKNGKIVME